MRLLGLLVFTIFMSVNSFALAEVTTATPGSSTGAASSEESQQKKKNAKKTTQVSFEDVLVQGKYHFSDEAVTTVEQDKVLDALLGVRTNFQDRISNSAEQY